MSNGIELPAELPGHWDTPDGQSIAAEYALLRRDQLGKGTLSDLALANAVFMASRQDLDLLVWQTAAKERIRWLSAHLALAQTPSATMGVTDNALLLLGYVAGLLTRNNVENDRIYEIESVDPSSGSQTVRHTGTGNLYSLAIEQVAGFE